MLSRLEKAQAKRQMRSMKRRCKLYKGPWTKYVKPGIELRMLTEPDVLVIESKGY